MNPGRALVRAILIAIAHFRVNVRRLVADATPAERAAIERKLSRIRRRWRRHRH